jgi:hypothetical protein
MATYTYTNSSALISPSTIRTTVPVLPPDPFTLPSAFYNNYIQNTRNLAVYLTYNTGTAFPDFSEPFPQTFDWVCPIGEDNYPDFADAVYDIFCQQQDDSFNSFENDTVDRYFLVTTAIDAGIAALPSITPAEIARKAYLVSLRQDIQDEFDTADYATANTLIGVVESYLNDLTNASVATTAVLANPTEIDVDISILAFNYLYWGGWYNALTNTLTSVVYPYTFNFDPNNGGAYTVVNPTDYPDGVYENYMSVLGSISSTDSNLFFGTSYALVTTTIDDQIALYGTNHDPNNTAEAIALAELLQLQIDIATAYAANDYTETNALIAQAQAILENGLSIELFAALTSDNLMNVYFDALPTGVYTNPTGVITNTLTGVSFTFDGFPSSNLDLATVLNSETLGFGADFPDGVYQVQVQFFVDGLLFTGLCYLVVTTDWQCCIDKAVGKKCGKLNTALMQANLTNAVRIVAVYSDVNTANALISEGYRECSGCGCGCS